MVACLSAAAMVLMPSTPAAATQPTYRANDYGNMLNILPAGQNGLATLLDVAKNKVNGSVPPHFNDQYAPYQNLLYAPTSLTDAQLTSAPYYKDASFGLQPQDVARVEKPANTPGGTVTIYRDKQYDVPHIYGSSTTAMAYGAGYITAEDRLFMIDVLRHYGAGHLSQLVGPSCGNEQKDHDQLQLTGYTQQDKQNQLDYISTLGSLGTEARAMIHAYVQGINKYISDAVLDPVNKLPAEYPVATVGLPQPWQDTDIIDIASLVGGIFGKGGGDEVASGHLMQFLQAKFGPGAGYAMFKDFHEVNDPDAPTVVTDKSFPYELQGPPNPSKNALTDPAAPVTDPSDNQTSGCSGVTSILNNLKLPAAMSNALLVDAKHSASGRPIAVMGPQVGYFAPEILQEVDLHAPDYDARGASFPGTSFLVELGRGQDYAWSATSADTDVVDQRLELMCPDQGAGPDNKYYQLNGHCVKMSYHDDEETALTKPGGQGLPVTIHHNIYRTNASDPVQGVVLGFTRTPADPQHAGGQPVAIVTQRSTYGHELDSAEGFLRWQHPSLTHDAQSWMEGANKIGYTFNWFYVDNQDIAYHVSGHDPIRPSDLDANLPTWGDAAKGTGWQGFLSDAGHPQEINPPQGFLTSWNNKPAPGFGASDATYGFGPVFRQQTLADAIKQQFALHPTGMTRANLVTAMEQSASVDLSGARVEPELVAYLQSAGISLNPATTGAMMSHLDAWVAAGAHRRRAAHGDTQYTDSAGVAIMDELEPHLVQAIFDSVLNDPGRGGTVETKNGLASGYSKFPMGFTDLPSGRGGSSYDGGFEGYLVKAFRQLRGASVGQPYSAPMMGSICAGSCVNAITKAVNDTYNAMQAANGGSSNVAAWTRDDNQAYCAGHGCPTALPAYDNISYQGVGVIGQPDMDWQNRPTFQQVADFPSHRPRDDGGQVQATDVHVAAVSLLPNTSGGADLGLGILVGLGIAVLLIGVRRRLRRLPAN